MSINSQDILQGRRRLIQEAHLLAQFQATALPQFYDLIYTSNPLHSSALDRSLADNEPFLVMEFISGQTALDVARTIHRNQMPDYMRLEYLVWHILKTFTDFSSTIMTHGDGYLYSDLNPINLMVTDAKESPIRILDAGSLISLRQLDNAETPFTWAYIPPEYYQPYEDNQVMRPDVHYVLYTLGKTVWEILTNRQPYPAEDPDLREPKLQNYSPNLQKVLYNLVARKYENFAHLQQDLATAPTAKLPTSVLSVNMANEQQYFSDQQALDSKLVYRNSREILIEVRRIQIDTVQILRFSPDGRYIAVASQNRVELWDANTLQRIRQLRSEHQDWVRSLDFDRQGEYLAAGTAEGNMLIWHIGNGELLWSHNQKNSYGAIALTGNGELIATITKTNFYAIPNSLSASGFRKPQTFPIESNCLVSAKYQSFLLIGVWKGIQLWDWSTDLNVKKFNPSHSQTPIFLALSGSEKIVTAYGFVTDRKYTLIAWEIRTRKLLWEIQTDKDITDIAITHDGNLVAAGNWGGNLWVWNLRNKKLAAQTNDCGRVSTVAFAPDNRTIALATQDGEVRLYELDL